MRVVPVLALVVAACPGGGGPPGGGEIVTIASVRDVGAVQNPSLPGVVRGGGAAGRVGDHILWTFGDTQLGATSRSSSAAFADPASPTLLSEPLDGAGAPLELLPLSTDEAAAGGWTLRPRAVLPFAENGLIVYARARQDVHASVGMALVRPGSTVAERYPEVFTGSDPPFHHAAALDAGDLYLYACGATTARCRIARAPFATATDRTTYQFWTGAGWSPDVTGAIEDVPGSSAGFTVWYVTYLERFVALAGVAGSGRVTLRVAPQPEGPWSEAVVVVDLGAAIENVVGHPELDRDAGRRIYFSYQRAQEGEMRLVEVGFE